MVGMVGIKRLLMASLKELADNYERLAHKVDTKINSLDDSELKDMLAGMKLIQKEITKTQELIDKLG